MRFYFSSQDTPFRFAIFITFYLMGLITISIMFPNWKSFFKYRVDFWIYIKFIQ